MPSESIQTIDILLLYTEREHSNTKTLPKQTILPAHAQRADVFRKQL